MWCLPPAEMQCVRSSRELHRNCGGFQNEAVTSACTAENTLKPTELELLKITLFLALHMCISVCLCVGYVHVKSEDGIGYPEAGVAGSREMPGIGAGNLSQWLSHFSIPKNLLL